MTSAETSVGLVLRHEYGRIVASLLRELGAHRLAQIEDGIAQAMLEATVGWRARGVPPNAAAYLHRAARNRVIDELRRERKTEGLEAAPEPSLEPTEVFLADELHDDELRALFACADPSIPLPSQIVFALRALSGFSTREIARRLVTSEENVQKRWERARDALAQVDLSAEPTADDRAARVESVLRMIYVVFTEGYFASSGERVLRLELCQEAIRLAGLVARNPRTTCGAAWALVALQHLHHARRDARVGADGIPVSIEDQDRGLYRRDELAVALDALTLAGPEGRASKYGLEAAIAGEHAFAPTFADTRWGEIVALYEALARIDPSPLHELHASIALSYAEGPEAALARLATLRPPTWLAASHMWLATYADLHRRLGHEREAEAYYAKAMALAPPIEREMLARRMRRERPRGGGRQP